MIASKLKKLEHETMTMVCAATHCGRENVALSGSCAIVCDRHS
jgi:hypothetical protein